MTHEPAQPNLYYLAEGAEVYIGRPRNPLGDDHVKSIGRLVRGLPRLREAHLPQLFVPGLMQQPAQVLVIGTDADPAELAEAVGRLQALVAEKTGQVLDVLPLSNGSPLWTDIRNQQLGLALT